MIFFSLKICFLLFEIVPDGSHIRNTSCHFVIISQLVVNVWALSFLNRSSFKNYSWKLLMKTTAENYSWTLQLKTTDENYSLTLQLKTTAEHYSWKLELKTTAENYSWTLQLKRSDVVMRKDFCHSTGNPSYELLVNHIFMVTNCYIW